MQASKKKPQELLFSLILLVFTLGICELFAGVAISQILGHDRSDYLQIYRKDPQLNLLTWTERYTAHPYFGYESSAIREFDVAKDAFGEEDFVIGILGGSVAEMFADYVIQNPAYVEQFKQAFPQFSDKTFRIVNLAMGGGKQPQQFFIATYYADDLDLIINIDGFNAFAGGLFIPVYPLEFPIMSLKLYDRSTGGEIYAALGSLSLSTYKLATRVPLRLRFLSKSSLYFGAWYLSADLLYKATTRLQDAYYDSTIAQHQTDATKNSDHYEEKVKIWKRYTSLQNQVLTQELHTRAYFFLQPNQYLADSKVLSDEERAHSFDESIAEQWSRGMDLLHSEYQTLEREGLPIFDMTPIFSATSETVYQDACCHLNELGNSILGENILRAIRDHQANTKTHRESE